MHLWHVLTSKRYHLQFVTPTTAFNMVKAEGSLLASLPMLPSNMIMRPFKVDERSAFAQLRALKGWWEDLNLSSRKGSSHRVVAWKQVDLILQETLDELQASTVVMGLVKLENEKLFSIGWRAAGTSELHLLSETFTRQRLSWITLENPHSALVWVRRKSSKEEICSSSRNSVFVGIPIRVERHQLQLWTFGSPRSIWSPLSGL